MTLANLQSVLRLYLDVFNKFNHLFSVCYGCGDLDVYFCGKSQYADELVKGIGVEVKLLLMSVIL